MKVFILGGKGFIGSAFVRFCHKTGVEFASIDLDNYRQFTGQGCDVLINASGNSKKFLTNEKPVEDFRFSLEALLRSFFDFSFQKYIYISSIDVYSYRKDPRYNREDQDIDIENISHYGFHKYLGEKMVEHYLSDWLIIRLGGVLGPGLKKNPVYDLLHGVPLRVSEESEYQYLSTDYLAEIIFGLIEKKKIRDIFNICGDGTVPIKEIRSWLNKPLCYCNENPRRERYEINNEKIKSLFHIPNSGEVVKEFISQATGEEAGAA